MNAHAAFGLYSLDVVLFQHVGGMRELWRTSGLDLTHQRESSKHLDKWVEYNYMPTMNTQWRMGTSNGPAPNTPNT